MLIAFFIGLFVRLDDYLYWKKHPQNYFIESNRPIFTNLDGFHFAEKAKHILKKITTKNRNFKNIFTFREQGPAILTAFLMKLFNSSPEKISVWLSPVLASLIVIPIILFFFDKLWIGFIISIGTVTSLAFVSRSTICWLDTDSLNLSFPLFLSLSVYYIANTNSLFVRLTSLIIFFLSFGGWKSWYRHIFLEFPWMGLLILSIALVTVRIGYKWLKNKNTSTKDKITLTICIIILFFIILWIIKHYFYINNFSKIAIRYIKSLEARSHPSPKDSFIPRAPVSELVTPSVFTVANAACGNIVLFFISIIGLLIVLWKKPWVLTSLFPLLILGSLSFKIGMRFSMFLVPICYIGIGYFLSYIEDNLEQITKISKTGSKNKLAFHCLISLLILISNYKALLKIAKPAINPHVAKTIIEIKKLTPNNAWIWAWWDMGYPIQYYAERKTYVDGSNQNKYFIYMIARSLSSSSAEEAYKIISISQNKKMLKTFFKNLHRFKGVGAALMSLKTPKITKPVYLFLSQYDTSIFPTMYYIGTWDFLTKKGKYPFLISMSACKRAIKWVTCKEVKIDLTKYMAFLTIPFMNEYVVPIKKAIVVRKDGSLYVVNRNPWGLIWVVVEKNDSLYSFIMEESVYNSMFSKLYLVRSKNINHFKLIIDNFPWGVLYKITE